MRTLEQKFWEKVDRRGPDDCWPWSASTDKNGYGQIGMTRTHRRTLAHRLSWTIANGPIPNGLSVLHRCDNPGCVNPGHLFVGTPFQNTRDCIEKGRFQMGETHGNARLNNRAVHKIFALRSRGFTQKQIGKSVGCTQSNVSRILLGKMWVHLGLLASHDGRAFD